MGPPSDPGPSGSARVSKWSVCPCFILSTGTGVTCTLPFLDFCLVCLHFSCFMLYIVHYLFRWM
ncbi:unnamed protein product, partial [Staurois parvus]